MTVYKRRARVAAMLIIPLLLLIAACDAPSAVSIQDATPSATPHPEIGELRGDSA